MQEKQVQLGKIIDDECGRTSFAIWRVKTTGYRLRSLRKEVNAWRPDECQSLTTFVIENQLSLNYETQPNKNLKVRTYFQSKAFTS